MRKAILVDLRKKKDKQYEDSLSLQPHERIDYLFELIKLSKGFGSQKKLSDINPETVVLSRK